MQLYPGGIWGTHSNFQSPQLRACLSLAKSFPSMETVEWRQKFWAVGVREVRQKEGSAGCLGALEAWGDAACCMSPPRHIQAFCPCSRQCLPGCCTLGAPSRSPVGLQLTPGTVRSEMGKARCYPWPAGSAPGAAPLAPSADSPSFPCRQQVGSCLWQQAACLPLSQVGSNQRHSCNFL